MAMQICVTATRPPTLGRRPFRKTQGLPTSKPPSQRGRRAWVTVMHQSTRESVESGAVKATDNSGDGLIGPSFRRRALLLSGLPCGCLACSGATAASVPPRNQWRDSFFAQAMNTGMGEYEELLQPVKTALFADVLGNGGEKALKVVEVGIGTAPNLKYYPRKDIEVVGVDPNAAMAPFAYETASRLGIVSRGTPPIRWP